MDYDDKKLIERIRENLRENEIALLKLGFSPGKRLDDPYHIIESGRPKQKKENPLTLWCDTCQSFTEAGMKPDFTCTGQCGHKIECSKFTENTQTGAFKVFDVKNKKRVEISSSRYPVFILDVKDSPKTKMVDLAIYNIFGV